MAIVKVKEQKEQKVLSCKENLILETIKTV